jgi:hypothetical protein
VQHDPAARTAHRHCRKILTVPQCNSLIFNYCQGQKQHYSMHRMHGIVLMAFSNFKHPVNKQPLYNEGIISKAPAA